MTYLTGGERAGLLAAIAGFALFSLGDAITKTMIGEWSPVAVAATRFALGALFLGTLRPYARGAAPSFRRIRGGRWFAGSRLPWARSAFSARYS